MNTGSKRMRTSPRNGAPPPGRRGPTRTQRAQQPASLQAFVGRAGSVLREAMVPLGLASRKTDARQALASDLQLITATTGNVLRTAKRGVLAGAAAAAEATQSRTAPPRRPVDDIPVEDPVPSHVGAGAGDDGGWLPTVPSTDTHTGNGHDGNGFGGNGHDAHGFGGNGYRGNGRLTARQPQRRPALRTL